MGENNDDNDVPKPVTRTRRVTFAPETTEREFEMEGFALNPTGPRQLTQEHLNAAAVYIHDFMGGNHTVTISKIKGGQYQAAIVENTNPTADPVLATYSREDILHFIRQKNIAAAPLPPPFVDPEKSVKPEPKIGQFQGTYQPPPPPPLGVAPFREPPPVHDPNNRKSVKPPPPPLGVAPSREPPPVHDPNNRKSVKPPPPELPTVPPRQARTKEADLKADTLQDAARAIEQSMKQIYLERDGKNVAVKANIEKSPDGSYTAIMTFPGSQKPQQSRNFSKANIEGYAKQYNDQNLEQLTRAIEAARKPIEIPKKINKYVKNLEKTMDKFVNDALNNSGWIQRIYKTHFENKKEDIQQKIQNDPNLRSQFKLLLMIQYLETNRSQLPKSKEPHQQYLSDRLTQVGAMLRGSGYQIPQQKAQENTSRPVAITHSLQRNQQPTPFVSPKPQEPQVNNNNHTPPPRPGGKRNND
ncbi:MAG: hypothetical protein AB7I18_00560 [Candidatus Berkiella sp.]